MTGPIMIVDDDPASLEALRQILASEYELVFARSGTEALAATAKHHPALVLLDVMMPDMDGYTVCRRLKADPRTVNIPVIFVTGMSEVGDETAGFAAGAVDYLIKPVSPTLVRARVRIHLSLVSVKLLEESEAYARALYYDSRNALGVMDLETGRFTDANEAASLLFGLPGREAMLGLTPLDISAPVQYDGTDSATLAKGHIETALNRGSHIFEWRFRRQNGEEWDGEVHVMSSQLGGKTLFQFSMQDISERRRNEQALLKLNEDLLRSNHELNMLFKKVEAVKKEWEISIDSSNDMVVIIDGDNKIKRCNRSFRDFTGRSFEALLGQDWYLVLADIGLQLSIMFKDTAEVMHKQSGRWFQFVCNPFKLVDGDEWAVVTIHDMTEMKNMTEALEITNREIEGNRLKLETALDEIASLIQQVTFRKDFSVRFSNPHIRKCYEVMGCTNKECPYYGREAMRCWLTAGTLCGEKARGEFADKYGNCMNCSNYRIATSDPIYQIGENFNNMMHILELQHKELENAYNNLKIAQSQITQQEKMASIGQLAAGVAHEINNPTGFIMSNLGSLQKYVNKLVEFIKVQAEAVEGLSEERKEEIRKKRSSLKVDFITEDIRSLVSESLDGTERIKKIVQDLKSFSRVDEAEQKRADINAGIESTINIVWNELKYKATVNKEYGDIPHTMCNPGQLNQVFMNILVNAAHAIEKQGEIRVRTWHEGGYINVSISDTGSGIPADKLPRIFEPFYTTKEVGKGTGLGLSIAYDIVKKHNGEIEVESEVGKGTTFTITIPIVEK